MTTPEKGRSLPRVHALYGPRAEDKVRKFRCCVQAGLTDGEFSKFVAEVKAYLESTLGKLPREAKADPNHHSTDVRFALGKAHHRLGIQETTITLGQLRSGRTKELRDRFDAAINAARRKVEDQRPEAA